MRPVPASGNRGSRGIAEKDFLTRRREASEKEVFGFKAHLPCLGGQSRGCCGISKRAKSKSRASRNSPARPLGFPFRITVAEFFIQVLRNKNTATFSFPNRTASTSRSSWPSLASVALAKEAVQNLLFSLASRLRVRKIFSSRELRVRAYSEGGRAPSVTSWASISGVRAMGNGGPLRPPARISSIW